MSDALPDLRLASHTLNLLRGMDQRQRQMMELILRQQDLIARLERDMRDGFSLIDRDMRDGLSRSDRDLKEIKSEMVVLESRLLQIANEFRERNDPADEYERYGGSSNGLSNGTGL